MTKPIGATMSAARNLGRASPESVGLSREGLARVDAGLQDLIDRGQLPGAVTLVARHGQVVHTSVMGKKDLASGEPLAEDTLFRIFSMTKPVTAAAMMILHEQGVWSPDDPVTRFLPELSNLSVLTRLDEAAQPVFEPAESTPTLRELLTHTAGFSYGFDPNDPVDKLYQKANPMGSASLDQMIHKLAELPLAYQPGTQWRYSLAMDIQGAIIERVTGQSLPDFMRTRLFEPLGMVDTAFHTPPEKKHRLATLYQWGKAGLEPMPRGGGLFGPDPESPPGLAMGGGGLISTAADYARFAQMLLNKGEFDGVRILKPESVAQMTRNHITDDIIAGGYAIGFHTFRPGLGQAYNGVVFTDPARAGSKVGPGTYQWDGAAGTWFWIDPTHDLLYVGLIQRLALPGAPYVQKLTQDLMAGAFA
jgi:CubicO group peptidase (beta-lactamase class C family)